VNGWKAILRWCWPFSLFNFQQCALPTQSLHTSLHICHWGLSSFIYMCTKHTNYLNMVMRYYHYIQTHACRKIATNAHNYHKHFPMRVKPKTINARVHFLLWAINHIFKNKYTSLLYIKCYVFHGNILILALNKIVITGFPTEMHYSTIIPVYVHYYRKLLYCA